MQGEPAARSSAASESDTVHDVLLVAWIALLAADRIDLLGGNGALMLTPYLALTPLVVLSEMLRRILRGRPLILPGSGIGFLAVVCTLLAFVGASVLVSQETQTSASRALLLAVQVAGTITVVLTAWDRVGFARLLSIGAVAGVLIYTLFDVLQVAALLGSVPELFRLGSMSIDFRAGTYGGFVPRLTGVVADPNRAGMILLFYAWFVSQRPGRPVGGGILALIAVLMLTTLSRSVAVASMATIAIVVLERRVKRVSTGGVLAFTLFVVGTVGTLIASPRARAEVETTLQPLARRLSLDEGSSQVHVVLLERGIDEGTKSISRLALGIGYGSAFTVLQDVFPGNRYGNFHSIYVSMFAESGLVALICILMLFAVPLARGGPFRPLVAGAAVFNLFYQATNEPALWMILAFAWFTMPPTRRRVVARVPDLSEATAARAASIA